MKKRTFIVVLCTAVLLFAGTHVCAQEGEGIINFGYDAGLDIVSAYLWRGQYVGGLSAQPTLDIGWDSEHTSFRFGGWASVGASDWKFQKGLEETELGNPNTYFVPEIDVIGSLNLWGVTMGFSHYYYFNGSNFFCSYKMDQWKEWALNEADEFYNNTSTTEISLGYDFSTLDLCGLYFNWNMTVNGNDFRYIYNEDDELEDIKRNWSSYIEIGYNHEFEDQGLTLGGFIGFVPWASETYFNEKFAVNCLSLRLDKEWDFDVCSLNLYAQGMINPSLINKENAYINAAGDEKLYCQQLNGCIGLGIWF